MTAGAEPEAIAERRWECVGCGAIFPSDSAPEVFQSCAWCGDGRFLSKPNPAAELARLRAVVTSFIGDVCRGT